MQPANYPAYEIKPKQVRFRPHRFEDALAAAFALQKDRLVLWLPVFFALGIGFYFSLRTEPPFIMSAPFLCAGFLGSALLWGVREKRPLLYGAWLVSFMTLVITGGFFTAQIRTHHVKTPVLAKEAGPVEVTGTIENIERLEAGKGNRIILINVDIEKMPQKDTPSRVRIKLHDGGHVDIGDKVSLLAGLNPPSAPVAPDAFDFQRYAYFEKIGAFGFAYRDPEILEKAPVSSFSGYLAGLRQSITSRIEKHLPYPEASFAMTMLTGQRSSITEEDWEAMRSSGLAHMLAISGLHVGLVAAVIFFTSRLFMASFPTLALRHPIKKYAAVIAFAGALGYTLLVGASIPTQRALIMTGVTLFAIILDRSAISLRLAAIAAFIVLLLTPEALFGAGFQMSFAAVTGLIAFYEAIRPYWSGWHSRAGWGKRILLYIFGTAMTTVIATIATAPFSIYHFQHFAPYSLPANLIAVPVMGFIVMPSVVLTLLLLPVKLEFIGLGIMEQGIKFILDIAHDVASVPGAAMLVPAWPQAALLTVIAGSLFLVLWKGHIRFISLATIMLVFFIIYNHKQPDIIISSSGELILFNDNDTDLHISSRLHDRFNAEVIARRFGKEKENLIKFPSEGALYNGNLMKCGEHGCRLVHKGHKIALSYTAYAQESDCEWADILISKNPVTDWECNANTIIDKFDLWRNGAHALWMDTEKEGGFTVKNIAATRGQRPWTVHNR